MTKNNTKRVTLKDIANKTGYTVNTVSRALNGKSDISEKTTKYIVKTAKDMGYINNSIASSLRSGRTKTIAIVIGDISNPLFGIMVKEIETQLFKQNYNSIIINSDENPETEKKAIIACIGKNVDGFIICPTQKDDEIIHILTRDNYPFVLIGRYFNNLETDYIIWDDFQGGFTATQHLLSLGHKDILYIGPPSYISSAKQRLEGYKAAHKNYGLKYNKKNILEVSLTAPNISSVLKKHSQFSAVFAFSDMLACEVIYELNRLGKKVPDDVSVIGFDNILSKFKIPFPLTSIQSPKTAMANLATETLLNKINKKTDKLIQKTLETYIAVRESTKKI